MGSTITKVLLPFSFAVASMLSVSSFASAGAPVDPAVDLKKMQEDLQVLIKNQQNGQKRPYDPNSSWMQNMMWNTTDAATRSALTGAVTKVMQVLSPIFDTMQIMLSNMVGPKVWMTTKSVEVDKKGPQPGDLIYNNDTHEKMMGYLFDLQSAYFEGRGLPTLLLYSETPGTGKTEFVKRLANLPECDFEVVMLHVSHLVPQRSATGAAYGYPTRSANGRTEFEHLLAFVNAPYKMYRVGSKTAKKTILFLDEGERLLAPKLATGSFDERTPEIEAFLNAMGSLSQHFTIAISTNNPGQIDKAVLNRFTHHIHVEAPDVDTRERLFRYYLSEKISSHERYKNISIANDIFAKNGKPTDAIRDTEGLAGRAISQISYAAVDRAYFNSERNKKPAVDKEDEFDNRVHEINHKLVLNKISEKKREIQDQDKLRLLEEEKRMKRYRENLRITAMRQIAEKEARMEVEKLKKEMSGQLESEEDKTEKAKKLLKMIEKQKGSQALDDLDDLDVDDIDVDQ